MSADLDKACERARALIAAGGGTATSIALDERDGKAMARALVAMAEEREAMAAVCEAAVRYVGSMQTAKALSLDGLAYRELYVARNRAALIAAVGSLRASRKEAP